MPSHHLRHLLLPALLLPLAAQADWRYTAVSEASAAVQVQQYQFGRDGRLWRFDYDAVRRYDAQGRPSVLRRFDALQSTLAESGHGGLLLDDGGALLMTEQQLGGDSFCNVQRLDAQGRPSWRVSGQGQYWSCGAHLYSNGAGDAWLNRGESLSVIDRDGRLGADARAGSANGRGLFGRSGVVLDDGSIIAAWYGVDVSGSVLSAHLSRFGRNGMPAWTWRHAAAGSVEQLLARGDGGVIGALDDFGDGSRSAVIRWNADGSEAWRLPAPLAGSHVVALRAAAQGDSYAVFASARTQTAATRIVRVSAQGQLRWQRDVDCALTDDAASTVAVNGDDSLAVVCPGSNNSNASLLRLSPSGQPGAPLDLPLRSAAQLLLQPDGKLLLLGSEAATPFLRRSFVVDGSSVQPAASDGLRDIARTLFHHSLLAADGNSYLTIAEQGEAGWAQYLLQAVDNQGRRRWSRALPERNSLQPDTLSASVSRVCAIGTDASASPPQTYLMCRAASDGRLLWQAALPTTQGLATRLFDDGSVVAVSFGGGHVDIRRFDAHGSERGNGSGASGNHGARAAIDAFGRVTVVTGTAVSQFDADGQPRYHLDGAALPLQLDAFDIDGAWQRPELVASDDGNVWIAAPPANASIYQRSVWSIAGNGSTRWVRAVEEKPGLKLVASATAVHIAQWGDYGSDGRYEAGAENVVTTLDRSDGALRWRHVSHDPLLPGYSQSQRPDPRTAPALEVSADGDSLLLVHGWRDRLRLQRLDMAGGRLAHERFVACAPACAAPYALAADRDKRLRLSADAFDPEAGSGVLVLALDGAAAAQPAIRIDQAGIDGAWWSPYANGEGIAFDWLPASRTLFGAWFTYGEEPDNDAAGLRWYTLQANAVSAGTRRLELPILRTGGGNFAAGPAVAPQRVGTATLEFHDCSNASLNYAFDATHNGGRRGTVTLSRLSPATTPCLLADGSSLPGSGARPPQQGFDARMSGTWFDPAVPGQGLQLTVQPGGVFFAPWFTFDPAGDGNDAARQHWFTLQGDLAQASGGGVDLQLIQTTGGAFDRVPTSNAYVVGSARLQMLACDRARLDYRFGSSSAAAAFAGLTGSLALEKAGGCAAP